MMRDARRSLVLAAVLLGASLGASACTAREGVAAATSTAKVDINVPHTTSPDFVTEPLSIETASGRLDYRVEIADDDAERQHGLMYRTSMPDMHGMLFIFPQARPQAFWMRNTYMPLDIIYIGEDGRIVSIAANARPFDESPLPSEGPAIGVLEIYGGKAAELGIKPGDRVRHRMFGQ
jgi:uncharacterized membrane protein (UPF0127 family)